jgi:hypothetical protein
MQFEINYQNTGYSFTRRSNTFKVYYQQSQINEGNTFLPVDLGHFGKSQIITNSKTDLAQSCIAKHEKQHAK